MRPLVLFAFLFASVAGTPALAEHPKGSPLNPESYDHWVELGRYATQASRPSSIFYVDMEKGQPAWYDPNHMAVHTWEIYDQPWSTSKGLVTELQTVYLVDCGDRTLGDNPIIIAYDANGDIVLNTINDVGPTTTMHGSPPGTGGSAIFEAVCS